MRIAVVGAGAIGGYLGARLSLAGNDVVVVARNRNLQAISANGLRLILEQPNRGRIFVLRTDHMLIGMVPLDRA